MTNLDFGANLAGRVENNPKFLAHQLAQFRHSTDCDDATLVAFLRCDIGGFNRLRLCRAIDLDQPDFGQRVMETSDYSGCDADKLLGLLRRVASIQRMGGSERELAGGGLMAARRKVRRNKPTESDRNTLDE